MNTHSRLRGHAPCTNVGKLGRRPPVTTRRTATALTLALLATLGSTTAATSQAATAPEPAFTALLPALNKKGSVGLAPSVGAPSTLADHRLISAAPDGSVQLYTASIRRGGVPSLLAAAVVNGRATLLPDVDDLAMPTTVHNIAGVAGEGRIVRFDGKRTFYSYDPVTAKRTTLAPFTKVPIPHPDIMIGTYTPTRDGVIVSVADFTQGTERTIIYKVTTTGVTRLAIINSGLAALATYNGRIDAVMIDTEGSDRPQDVPIRIISITGTTVTTTHYAPQPSKKRWGVTSLGYARNGTAMTPVVGYWVENGDGGIIDVAAGTKKSYPGVGLIQVSAGAVPSTVIPRSTVSGTATLSGAEGVYPSKVTVDYNQWTYPRSHATLDPSPVTSKWHSVFDGNLLSGYHLKSSTEDKIYRDHSFRLKKKTQIRPFIDLRTPYLTERTPRTTTFQVRHHLRVTTNRARTSITISSVTAEQILITTKKGSSTTKRTLKMPASNTLSIAAPKDSRSKLTITAVATKENVTNSMASPTN